MANLQTFRMKPPNFTYVIKVTLLCRIKHTVQCRVYFANLVNKRFSMRFSTWS